MVVPTVAFKVCNSAPADAFTSTTVEVAPTSNVMLRVKAVPMSTFCPCILA